MILSGFIDRPDQLASWIFQRQWAEWEIITIAVIVVFVVLWIMKGQRKRAYRNVYDNQFLESTPVIGTKLGSRKRRRHLIRDFKKAQLAAAQHVHANQQKSAKRTDSEKLHEQIRQLQREIIKRKKSEVRLEEKVAYLTSVNEKLQLELAGLKQGEQPAEIKDEVVPTSEEQLQPEIPEDSKADQPVAQEPATDEKEQPVISENGQIEQDIEKQDFEISAKDEHVERKPPKRSKTYEDLHRVVDDVKQKFCRKCSEWKPKSEFHKNASSKDGLAGSCKTCKAEAAKEYRRRRKTSQD
ncbi:MAG: hypothetical protein ACYS3S_18240 [Planctomycetota bacterium]|jgi:hypothetical protein